CARSGCRAWAMRGREYCRAHQTQRDRAGPSTDPVTPSGDDAPSDRYRSIVERRVLDLLGPAPPEGSLAEEIGALRLVLARVLEAEDDPARLAASIPRIVDVTVRAVRAQRTLGGATAENLTEALTQVLLEMGLGGES